LASGELVRSLMRHNLIDEYILLIHPLILGSRRRLFTDGGRFAALRLVNSQTSTTGVVIATYQPRTVGRKNYLKQRFDGFDKKTHGAQFLNLREFETVLGGSECTEIAKEKNENKYYKKP